METRAVPAKHHPLARETTPPRITHTHTHTHTHTRPWVVRAQHSTHVEDEAGGEGAADNIVGPGPRGGLEGAHDRQERLLARESERNDGPGK